MKNEDDYRPYIFIVKFSERDIDRTIKSIGRDMSFLLILFPFLIYIPLFFYKIIFIKNVRLTEFSLFLLELLAILFVIGIYIFLNVIYKSFNYIHNNVFVNYYAENYAFDNYDRLIKKSIFQLALNSLALIIVAIISLFFLIKNNINDITNLNFNLLIIIGIMNAVVFIVYSIFIIITRLLKTILLNDVIDKIFTDYIFFSGIYILLSCLFNV